MRFGKLFDYGYKNGTNKIFIQVDILRKTKHKVISINYSELLLTQQLWQILVKSWNLNPRHIISLINILKKMGTNFKINENSIQIYPIKS